jgi:hypothetical protein
MSCNDTIDKNIVVMTVNRPYEMRKITILRKIYILKVMKRILVLVGCTLCLLTACKKDEVADTTEKEILYITPEQTMSYLGKDWNSVVDGLKNKKGYVYSNVNNEDGIIAAAVIPAADLLAPAPNYRLLLNIGSGNKVSEVHLSCGDTLNPSRGNQEFLYFYNGTFAKITGDKTTTASYLDVDSIVRTTDEATLINMVKANSSVQPSLQYTTANMFVSATFFTSDRVYSIHFSALK